MEVNIEQKIVITLGYILSGIVGATMLLEAYLNAQSFFTIIKSIYATILLLAIYAAANLWVIIRRPRYQTNTGTIIRVKKLNRYYAYFSLGVLFVIWCPHLFSDNKFAPVFSKTDKHYKILILPFNQMCGQFRDVGLAIKANLDNATFRDTLNIKAVYMNLPKDSLVIDELFAENIKNMHNADMVIYGSYLTDECSSASSDEFCYNYVANIPQGFYPVKKTEFDFQSSSYSDIIKTKLSGNINYLIYYIQAVYSLEQNNKNRAIKYLKEALSKSTIHSSYIYLQLLNLFSEEKRFDEARAFLEKQKNDISITRVDSTFYFKYLYFSSIIEYRAEQFDKAVFKSQLLTALVDKNKSIDTTMLIDVYEYQTKLYSFIGNKNEAKIALEKASTIEVNGSGFHPNNIFSLIHLSFHSMNLSVAEKLLNKVEMVMQANKIEAFNIILEENYFLNKKNLYLLQGNNDLGLKYWDKLIEWRERFYEGNKKNTIASYYLKGKHHLIIGQEPTAIVYFEKGLKAARELELNKGYLLAISFTSRLCAIYEKNNEHRKAKILLNELLQMREKWDGKRNNEYIDLMLSEDAQNIKADKNLLLGINENILSGANQNTILYKQIHFFLQN